MSSAYAKFLDKSKPHGSIHPPENGAHFEQGGYKFDHTGELVDRLLTDEQRAKLKKKSAAAAKPQSQKPPAPSKDKADTDGGGEGDEGGEGGESADQEHEDGLNLSAWLKGEAEYATRDVQNAIKARYHKNCTKVVDMVDFLVEQNVAEKGELQADFKKLIDA